MNLKFTKTLSYTLAACLVIGSFAVVADAASEEQSIKLSATTSGISSISSTAESFEGANYSAFAGVSLSVNNMLSSSNMIAAETLRAENEAAAVAKNEYANIAIAQVDNYVYIRSEASADSEYVGKLYNNSAAIVSETVDAEDGQWLCITSGDCTGYVKSEYVVQNDEDLAKRVSRRVATVTCETLYVRENPSTEASIIDMIPYADDVTVEDESTFDSGWVLITCDAGEGYVSTDYVTLSTEYTLAESRAHEEARIAKEQAAKKAAQEAARRAASSGKSSAPASSGESKSYNPPSGSSGSAVIGYGSQFVGNPYRYGQSSLTNGTDCSGFVMSVYNAFGVSLPHSSSALRSVGYGVSYDEMQPGDIVCYSGHVGLYAGNGQLLHASNRSSGIKYSDVNYKKILAIRRIF